MDAYDIMGVCLSHFGTYLDEMEMDSDTHTINTAKIDDTVTIQKARKHPETQKEK
jgi:hypothetical protein